MKGNEENALGKLLGDERTLQKLSQSTDAQALAALLARGRDPAELERIAKEASEGNTEQLGALVRSIAGSPVGAELLGRLEKTLGSK